MYRVVQNSPELQCNSFTFYTCLTQHQGHGPREPAPPGGAGGRGGGDGLIRRGWAEGMRRPTPPWPLCPAAPPASQNSPNKGMVPGSHRMERNQWVAKLGQFSKTSEGQRATKRGQTANGSTGQKATNRSDPKEVKRPTGHKEVKSKRMSKRATKRLNGQEANRSKDHKEVNFQRGSKGL